MPLLLKRPLPLDHEFPWATLVDQLLGLRCKAVREPIDHFSYHGRCEFRVHGPDKDHCLERGMVNIRWSTAETLG